MITIMMMPKVQSSFYYNQDQKMFLFKVFKAGGKTGSKSSPGEVHQLMWNLSSSKYCTKQQSVSGRNKCMHGSSHMLCCAITRLIVSEPKHLITWSHRASINFFDGGRGGSNTLVFWLNCLIFNSLWLVV